MKPSTTDAFWQFEIPYWFQKLGSSRDGLSQEAAEQISLFSAYCDTALYAFCGKVWIVSITDFQFCNNASYRGNLYHNSRYFESMVFQKI